MKRLVDPVGSDRPIAKARRGSLAVAVAGAAATAPIAYAVLHGVEKVFFPEPNPVVLVWSDRSVFLWRSASALYVAGLAAFGWYGASARSPGRAARLLGPAIAVAALILVGATVALP